MLTSTQTSDLLVTLEEVRVRMEGQNDASQGVPDDAARLSQFQLRVGIARNMAHSLLVERTAGAASALDSTLH